MIMKKEMFNNLVKEISNPEGGLVYTFTPNASNNPTIEKLELNKHKYPYVIKNYKENSITARWCMFAIKKKNNIKKTITVDTYHSFSLSRMMFELNRWVHCSLPIGTKIIKCDSVIYVDNFYLHITQITDKQFLIEIKDN